MLPAILTIAVILAAITALVIGAVLIEDHLDNTTVHSSSDEDEPEPEPVLP